MTETRADLEKAENVFSVLANQARGRTRSELWTTAIGCGMNATLIRWQYPRLAWLAAAFTAASAYALWGLADRAVREAERTEIVPGTSSGPMIRIRLMATVGGTCAAAWALFSFMAAALANWNH